jgi:tripartite-type tricarboxylate transporter receptor subunit TctC
MQTFVAAAKAAPEKYTIGVAGIGSVSHIASELFQREAGIKLVTVPFPGSTPIINALMSDSIDVASDLIPAHIPLLQDKRYTPLAIASETRIPSLSQLPTVAEAGFPQFEASTFSALVAPTGTPEAIVQRLNKLVNAYLDSAEGRTQLATLEMIPSGGSPQDLQKLMDSEGAKWGPLIKSAGITVQ